MDERSGVEGLTRESLKPLLDLQRIDSRIDRLRALHADLPEQRLLGELEEERAAVASEHEEKNRVLEGLVRDQTRIETEVSMLDEKITHEQARLYSGEISSPKELSNIQAELDALRRRKNHVEDQLIELMEQRETLEADVGVLRQRLDDLDSRVGEQTARRDASAVEIEKELGELEAEREQLAPRFPQDVLDLYEELRTKKEGVGASALAGGVCRGCNVSLSPKALDSIKRSDDPVVRCENCRRILIPV